MGASYGLGSLLSIDDLIWCASSLSSEDSVWIPETWGMEGFAVLAAVSQRSRCHTIGSSILNVYSRSPAVLAMGTATLDTLSGGRFILGLGASSPAIVTGLHGSKYVQPVQRVREHVQIIRQYLSGDRIDYDGDIYQLQGFSLMVKPPRIRVPIYLAAVNQRMVDLTWEIADGIIFYLRPIAEMAHIIKTMQQGRHIHVACQIITAISEDAEMAYQRARRTLAFYISVGQVYREFLASNGYKDQTERIFDEYKTFGLRNVAKLVPDDMLHALTACGTPSECKATLDAFRKAGVDEPILQFNPTGDIHDSFRLLTAMCN